MSCLGPTKPLFGYGGGNKAAEEGGKDNYGLSAAELAVHYPPKGTAPWYPAVLARPCETQKHSDSTGDMVGPGSM